ncbi:hypothetical protein GCM10023083_01510 [Streptomyces phyllanthi]
MTDTPSAPPPLQLIDTGPAGGWCDAETGICTSAAPEPDTPGLVSLGESSPGADQAGCLPG